MALWRIRATVDDRPGYLAVLAAGLALKSVNILTVQVHTTEAGAVDDFLVDAPDAMTETDLVAAVEKGRGRDVWVAPARAQGLVDPPTQALTLAGRVLRDPDTLGVELRKLLVGDVHRDQWPAGTTVVWRPGREGEAQGVDGNQMWLPDPRGGMYEVVRSGPAFTPAEYARAQALVELARAAAGRAAAHTLLLPDGSELTLREATLDDFAAVRQMHGRCSARSLRRRYLGTAAGTSPGRLARLLTPGRCTTLIAEVADGATAPVDGGGDGVPAAEGRAGGRVVAMANLITEGVQAEAALLVEDEWQGRGLGTALLRRLTAMAAHAGCQSVATYTAADNTAVLPMLRRIDREAALDLDDDALTVTVALAGGEPRTAVGAGPAVERSDPG